MRALAALLAVSLASCQTTGYIAYAKAMSDIAEAKASVQREQMQMMMRIAESTTDQGTRMMAVAMIGMAANGGGGREYPTVQPPANEALQWVAALLPSATTALLGLWAYKANKHAVDAQSDVTVAGYGAMSNIAGAGFQTVSNVAGAGFAAVGQASGATTTTTNTTSYTIGTGPGVIGSGSVVLNPLPTPTAFGP